MLMGIAAGDKTRMAMQRGVVETMGCVIDEGLFRTRLNELFAGRGRRLTNHAVAKALLAQECQISVAYLSQLRNGSRDNPSDEVVAALAGYFGVSPGYFFTVAAQRDHSRARAEDAALVDRLVDPTIKYLLIIATELSVGSVNLLADMATKLRVCDCRLVIPADSPSYIRIVDSCRLPVVDRADES